MQLKIFLVYRSIQQILLEAKGAYLKKQWNNLGNIPNNLNHVSLSWDIVDLKFV